MGVVRVAELDGLRGLALLMVLLYHILLFVGFDRLPLSFLVDWTWTGLDIFLVLSGYLITGILLRAHGQRYFFLNFFLRRTVRIFPAYYATLAIIFLLFPLLSARFAASASRDAYWIFATYIQNWVFAFHGWPDWHAIAHLWSMAVEEQFYLMWPFVILFFRPHRMATVSLCVIALAITCKLVLFFIGPIGLLNYVSTVTRMDGIAAGALIACLSPAMLQRHKRWLMAISTIGAVLLAIVIFLIDGPRAQYVMGSIGMVLIAAAIVGCLHAGLIQRFMKHVLANRTLVWFGIRSYSIYLLHYPVQAVILEHMGQTVTRFADTAPLLTCLFVVPVSIGIFCMAALPLYYVIEAPFMRLRWQIQEPVDASSTLPGGIAPTKLIKEPA